MFGKDKKNSFLFLISFFVFLPLSALSQSNENQSSYANVENKIQGETDVTPPTINLLSNIQRQEVEKLLRKRIDFLNPPVKVIEAELPIIKPVEVLVNNSKKILAIYGRKSKQFVEILLPNGYIIAINAGFKNSEFEIKKIDDGEVTIEVAPKKTGKKYKNSRIKKAPEIMILSPGDIFV